MKALVVEEDFANRLIMHKSLEAYGDVHIAINAYEAIEAFRSSLRDSSPYELICLDVMMHGIDGKNVLREIRSIEEGSGVMASDQVKIIMTTAMKSSEIKETFKGECDAYILKPIYKDKLKETMESLGLIGASR